MKDWGRVAVATGEYSRRGLRNVLIAGFGGIAIIFVLAGTNAVALLNTMRAEHRILRETARQRTNHLASIRSYILLTHTYLGDYLLDSGGQTSGDYRASVQNARAQLRSDLAAYRAAGLDEEVVMRRLGELLNEHWQKLTLVLNARNHPRTFYIQQIVPLRTTVVEITTQLDGMDAKQLAKTELQIENEFERLGTRLRSLLIVALVAALLLALGCIVYISWVEGQNSRRYQEVLQLSARLVDAQETERRSISRELHDQVGQTLNALLMDAANLAKRIPVDDPESQRFLANILSFADSSVNSIRDIALLLRPSMLDDLGLIPALEWQARETARRSGIKIGVSAENVPDSLPDDIRTCVYRVVQEALQNLSRHSAATAAQVKVQSDGNSLDLTFEDDGRGFDPARTRGLGILGMEERVRQLRGRFEFHSAPGKGARLHIVLPIG